MKKKSKNKLGIVTIFAIAMAFIETTVVVYLREIYYEGGFDFPLKGFIDPDILAIEWIREFSTIIMLVAIGVLAGKKIYEKIAYFILAFSVWDIFYYVFLKVLLNWPDSFLTWDILFLIPLPWISPVLAPLICCLILIILSMSIIYLNDKGYNVKISLKEWTLLIFGMLLVLYTWLYDYSKLIFSGGYGKEFFSLSENTEFYSVISNFVPQSYNWSVFWLGILLASLGVFFFFRRSFKKR